MKGGENKVEAAKASSLSKVSVVKPSVDTKIQEITQKVQVTCDWWFISTEPKAVTVTH